MNARDRLNVEVCGGARCATCEKGFTRVDGRKVAPCLLEHPFDPPSLEVSCPSVVTVGEAVKCTVTLWGEGRKHKALATFV